MCCLSLTLRKRDLARQMETVPFLKRYLSVAEAQRVGIDVVPVVSVLGHAEFSYFERTVPFRRAQMLDPTRADIVSTVEISLKPEFD